MHRHKLWKGKLIRRSHGIYQIIILFKHRYCTWIKLISNFYPSRWFEKCNSTRAFNWSINNCTKKYFHLLKAMWRSEEEWNMKFNNFSIFILQIIVKIPFCFLSLLSFLLTPVVLFRNVCRKCNSFSLWISDLNLKRLPKIYWRTLHASFLLLLSGYPLRRKEKLIV